MSVDHDVPAGDESESGPDRRSLFKAAAAVAVPLVGVGAVAACASSNSKQATPAGGGTGGATAASGGGNTPVTVAVADVPVGGGKIDGSAGVVVTQPTAGQYKAFTAVCTHAGCTVAAVQNNQIECHCHGSVFSATDGSVVNGPATMALTPLTVTVKGGTIDVTGNAR